MSFIKVFAHNLLHFNQPGQLVLFVTNRCNCQCAMCFNAANVFVSDRKEDMSIEDIEKIARSLYPLPQLLLSGGEPFVRNDVAAIIHAFYTYAGTRQFSIPTNGTFTHRTAAVCEEVLQECSGITLNLNLSLDNIGAAHDKQRGLEGCYEHLCKTYEQLDPLRTRYKGLSVNINTVITENTVNATDEIVNTIRTRFSPNYHAVAILRSNHEAAVPEALLNVLVEKMCLEVTEKKSFNALPFLSRIVPALGNVIKKKYIRSLSDQKRCFTCLAGKKIIVITADGRLMPCEPLWLEEAIRKHENENHYLIAKLKEFDYDVTAALSTKRSKEIKDFVAEKKCWCSYMCAIQNGILYSPQNYPEVFLEILHR
ncbi:MAG: radical SAM protein [Candidatus Hydrogenedentes bacterium]|nr:radical SAM protein [Candidatus Hydrogenedentota bacterium]